MEPMNQEEMEKLDEVTGGAQTLAGQTNQSGSSPANSTCPKGGQHEWIRIDSSMSRCAKCNLFITV